MASPAIMRYTGFMLNMIIASKTARIGAVSFIVVIGLFLIFQTYYRDTTVFSFNEDGTMSKYEVAENGKRIMVYDQSKY